MLREFAVYRPRQVRVSLRLYSKVSSQLLELVSSVLITVKCYYQTSKTPNNCRYSKKLTGPFYLYLFNCQNCKRATFVALFSLGLTLKAWWEADPRAA